MNIVKKLNIIAVFAAIIVVGAFFVSTTAAHAQYYDTGYYDSGSSGYNDSYYGYNSNDFSNYNYGNSYNNNYDYSNGYGYNNSYDNTCYDCNSGYSGGYYSSGYDTTCYDCGGSYYNNNSTCSSGCNTYVPPVQDVFVSCNPNTYSTNINTNVTWNAYASGGNGSYSYSWSGTDGLSGSGSSASHSYSSSGTKTASVTVTSHGKTASAQCGAVVVQEQQQTLNGSCSVNDTNINIGDSVTWSASASGGNGSYSYSWSGDYPLGGMSGSNPNVYYNSTGSKYGTVTITSGNQTITRSCGNVYVNENNNNQNLDVSCSIDDSNVNIGEAVRMSAYGSGGNGNYTYTWNGDYPLGGMSGSNPTVYYNSIGNKDVSVTVYSNGNSRTRHCGTVYVGGNNNNNNTLNLSCTVNSNNVAIGQNVIWTAIATGGNGNYSYSWSGTDSLYGYNSIMSKIYSAAGLKTAVVTVTSNGNTRSLNCPSVNVGVVGNLASLSSVYLNQVPYTGVGDNPKLLSFIIGLLLFSVVAAYFIVRNRVKVSRASVIGAFKEANRLRKLGK